MNVTLKNEFPNSEKEPFKKTSDISQIYNCIAWAAGDDSKWYEPDPYGMYYWPPEIPRVYSINAYISVFEKIGYIKCDNSDIEIGYEKVAVFSIKRVPTHAARQLSNGLWTSKLGQNIDVSHTIKAIEEGQYGNVIQFLKRKKT